VNIQELVVAPLEAEVEADVSAPMSPFLPMTMEDDWYRQACEADEAKWNGKANVQEALPPQAAADAKPSSVDDVELHVALADGQVLSHLSPVRLMKRDSRNSVPQFMAPKLNYGSVFLNAPSLKIPASQAKRDFRPTRPVLHVMSFCSPHLQQVFQHPQSMSAESMS
jgi:hypothetical protein